MEHSLDKPTVLRVAELARLHLSEEEVVRYQQELAKILGAFDALAKVDLPKEFEGDARSALVLKNYEEVTEDISRMQPDEVGSELATQIFLAKVPEREGVFVRVPAILSQST